MTGKMERRANAAVKDHNAREERKKRQPLKPTDVAAGAHRIRIFAQEIEKDGRALALFMRRAGITAAQLERAKEILKIIAKANLRKGDDLGTKWTMPRFKRQAAAGLKALEKIADAPMGRKS